MHGADGILLPTAEAIALTEEAGHGSVLDLWVVEQVVSVLRQQRVRGHPVRCFLKLSAQAVRDESMMLQITKIVRGARLPLGALTFEFNYEVATHQVKYARAMVSVLRQIGCQSALAGFGTEANSLHVLNHVDVDYLKIDPAVVAEIAHSAQAQESLRGLQSKARALDKETIATAVQDANTLAMLWQCGVRYAQGYYIQEPNRELSYEFTQT